MPARPRWRILVGLFCILWGLISLSAYFWPFLPGLPTALWVIISAIVLLLPGGLWSIALGFALLAYDLPKMQRFNEWLRAKTKEKFPCLYEKAIILFGAVKYNVVGKLRAWLERLKNIIWPKLVLGALVVLLAGVFQAWALEIENADKMPYPPDTKFIEAIWEEAVRVTNKEALLLKVEGTAKPPEIRYVEKQPGQKTKWSYPVASKINYKVSRQTGAVMLDIPRTITIYPAAFQRWVPDYHYTDGLAKHDGPFREQLYGIIGHEFLHETLFLQYVSDDDHHCAMVLRGTLLKVLQFIDERLGTGQRIADTVIGYVEGQCEAESGGRMRFPLRFKTR